MKARLVLKIRAGARATALAGQLGETWKLSVAAPPVDGKANAEIIRFLAKLTGIPACHIRIITGQTSTTKLLELDGLTKETLDRVMLESNGSGAYSGSASPRKT